MNSNRITYQPARLLVVVVAVLMATSVIAVGGAVAQDDGPPAPPHGVYGDVVDSDGDAVEGALVEIVDEQGEVIVNATTDETGAYSVNVKGLDEGDEFTVSVTGVENSDEKTLTWSSAASERVDLSVEISGDSGGGGSGGGNGGFPPGDGGDVDSPVPTAEISIDPNPATVGEEVSFTAMKSDDDNQEITIYNWVIDGESFDNKTVTTSFDEVGKYDIELTVYNNHGESDTATTTVTVEAGDPSSEPNEPGNNEDSDGTGADDDGDDSVPGFGVTIVLVALLSAMMLSLHRQN